MSKVRQQFTGDAKQLLAEYEKMRVQMSKLEDGQDKLLAHSKKMGKEQLSLQAIATEGTKRWQSSIKGLITSFASAQTALQLLNAEQERNNRLAEAARQTNITVGDAQAGVLKNIGDVSDKEAKAFLDQIADIQKGAKFQSQVPLLQAASSILSATAGDQDKTLEIVKAAAPFFRDSQDQLASFGGAVGDVMGVTGETNAKKALGLMLAIQGQARFESLEAFKNVAPALASSGVTQKGVDKVQAASEAAALFAAIGGRSGDVEGTLTKTAVANLSANLQAAFPQEGLSVLDRLAMAQEASTEVQDEILKSGFQGAIKPIMDELIRSGDSQTSQMTRDALSKIVSSEEYVDRKRAQIEGLTGALQTSTRAKTSEGNIEQFQMGVGGQRAEIRQILKDTLDAAGESALDNQMRMMKFDYLPAEDRAQFAIDELLSVRDKQQYGLFGIFGGATDAADLGPDQRAAVALIGEQVQLLYDIRDGLNRNDVNPSTHTENE